VEDQIKNIMDENNTGINWIFLILILIIVTHIVKIIKIFFCLVKEFDPFLFQSTSKKENRKQPAKDISVLSSSKKVYEGLNKIVQQRSTISSTKLDMEKELYQLKIKKAKISLETTEIEKEVMQKKLITQNLEVQHNEIKNQILLLELNNKRSN